jgi:hypothetical protein
LRNSDALFPPKRVLRVNINRTLNREGNFAAAWNRCRGFDAVALLKAQHEARLHREHHKCRGRFYCRAAEQFSMECLAFRGAFDIQKNEGNIGHCVSPGLNAPEIARVAVRFCQQQSPLFQQTVSG